MQETINYPHNFRASQLLHCPSSSISLTRKPTNPRAVPEKRSFDPQDLTRRLQLVIAEQEAYQEKKRQQHRPPSATLTTTHADAQLPDDETTRLTRIVTIDSLQERTCTSRASHRFTADWAARLRRHAAKEATPQQPAHEKGLPKPKSPYVPRVAASQFTATTMPSTHPMSRAASLRPGHTHAPSAHSPAIPPPTAKLASIEQAKILRHAQSPRNRNHQRPFSQLCQISAYSQSLDPGRLSLTSKRCSIYSTSIADPRPSRHPSVSSFVSKDFHIPPLTSAHLATVVEAHRVDWTQSDEKATSPKSVCSPSSSKNEWKWSLRRRLSFHRLRDKSQWSLDNQDLPPKSSMTLFLARWKR